MNKFSDIFTPPPAGDNEIFDCRQIGIGEVVNCSIVVVDFQLGVTTSFGDGRAVVKVQHAGEDVKFFTNAAAIKQALCGITKAALPFTTVVRAQKMGKNTSYKFT